MAIVTCGYFVNQEGEENRTDQYPSRAGAVVQGSLSQRHCMLLCEFVSSIKDIDFDIVYSVFSGQGSKP